jgi:protocatechuate 3,4-dioxygenase beta subunit
MSSGLAAQTAGEFSLGGTVTNSATGGPVARALVRVTRFDAPQRGADGRFVAPGKPFGTTTFTDAAGTFRFTGLAGGNYGISAEKPQFVVDTRTQIRNYSVNLTASVSDLRIQLAPLGAISGKVIGQDGEPLRNVRILALTASIVDGLRSTHADRNVTTDDRGLFRLWNLRPGRYYLKAAGYGGGTYSYSGDSTPQLFAEESFRPAYLGGAQALDSANLVTLAAGAEAQADFSLKLEPSHKVRGALSNFTPHRTATFELMAGDEDVSPSRVTVNNDTGRFEIQDVLPGAYLLRATQDDASGEAPVSVSGADLSGVNVTLYPAMEIRGMTRFMNAAPETEFRGRRFAGGNCVVVLHRSGKSLTSQPKENGEFVISRVQPGTYRVTLQCFGGYATSATAGTQDLLTTPLLVVAPGSPPKIEVEARHGGGSVEVTVAGPEPPRAEDAMRVLLAPTFAGSAGAVEGVCGREDGAREFRCVMMGLAPGTYTAYAFLNREDIEFRNPAFLAGLSGGSSLQVEDGAQKTLRLEVAR